MRSQKASLTLATENFLSHFFYSFYGNHFSSRFMLPCHCEPKIYLRFFEACTYHSIQNFVLEPYSRLFPCNAIWEGRPPLSNTSSEAGALPLERRIENDSDQKIKVTKFSKIFWKPLFSMFHAILFILSRKYFFGFRSPHLVKFLI